METGLALAKNGLFKPSLFDSMFDDFFASTYQLGRQKQWVFEKMDNGGVLTINALGHNPDDIVIELDNNQLIVKSEKPPGSSDLINPLLLKFTIGSSLSEKDIKATFNNGLVTVTLGNKEKSKPKRIMIE